VVHETASNNQDPNKTALYHVTPSLKNLLSKLGAPGLAYHNFITKSGEIYHCNDYTDITWHAGLYNTRSVGICLAYLSEDASGRDTIAPEEAQMLALEELLVTLCLNLKIIPQGIIGHREVPGMFTIIGKGLKKYKKTCPGMMINLNKLRLNIAYRLQVILAAEGLYTDEIDGLFGPLSIGALAQHSPDPDLTGWLIPETWVSSIDR